MSAALQDLLARAVYTRSGSGARAVLYRRMRPHVDAQTPVGQRAAILAAPQFKAREAFYDNNLLWCTLVLACNDDTNTMLDVLVNRHPQKQHARNYMIPHAKVWFARVNSMRMQQ